MVVYTDGSEFSGAPKDAPVGGVACVVQSGGPLRGKDYYYHRRGRWRGTDNPAAALEAHRRGDPLLHGEDMEDEAFAALIDKYLHR